MGTLYTSIYHRIRGIHEDSKEITGVPGRDYFEKLLSLFFFCTAVGLTKHAQICALEDRILSCTNTRGQETGKHEA